MLRGFISEALQVDVAAFGPLGRRFTRQTSGANTGAEANAFKCLNPTLGKAAVVNLHREGFAALWGFDRHL